MKDTYAFEKICKNAILNYLLDDRLDVTKVHTVWFCKTLRNCKGLFITELPDNQYTIDHQLQLAKQTKNPTTTGKF